MRPHCSVLFAILAAAAPAQQTNGLTVRREPQNVAASVLLGEWRRDEALEQRLGNKAEERLAFRDDDTILAKIPTALAAKLRDLPIRLAGVMTLRGKEQPFLLTEMAGNPTVVWFRERDGDPLGDAESFTVMAVRAEARQADLLFVGGDSNNQSLRPYARDRKVVGKLEPAAALTEMINLLVADKAREFVDTWLAPEDLAEVTKTGRTLDKLAERFQGNRRDALIEALTDASKRPPAMNAAGDEAVWHFDQPRLPKTLRLTRIDGRWYLRNR